MRLKTKKGRDVIKVFRTNGVLQIAIIAVAVVAIWLRWFIWPAEMVDETGSGPVYDLMRMVLGGVPVAATAVALGLTLAEGYVLNRMLYEKGLVPLNSLMPMLLYVIYMAIGCRGMSPVVVANLWVLLGLRSMMPKENLILEDRKIFNTGFWCSMAGLSWMPAIWVVVPIVIGQLTYKMYKGREWSVWTLGWLAPVIVVVTALFMADRIEESVVYAKEIAATAEEWFGGDWVSMATAVVVMVIGIVTTVGAANVLEGKTRVVRKHGLVMGAMLIYGAAAMVYEGVTPLDGGPWALGFATTGSVFMMEKRKWLWVYDVLLGLLFACAVVEMVR